jgi:clan AA aspartic protease
VIEGVVNANLEAVVTLPLQDTSGRTREVEAVVDTGFNGYLTLPPMLMEDLELPVVGDGEAVLADGSEAAFDVYGVTVLWDGQPMYVETGAVGVDPWSAWPCWMGTT